MSVTDKIRAPLESYERRTYFLMQIKDSGLPGAGVSGS